MDLKERITRRFAKMRSSGYVQYFDFVVRPQIFEKKTRQKNIEKLIEYLQTVVVCGTEMRPETVSAQPFLSIPCQKIQHEYIQQARESGSEGKGIAQHEITQNHLYETDMSVIALEVPVFDDQVSGFIDILRVSPSGRIEIWDFKPKATKEKRAAGQLYTYRYLLARCTGIAIDQFDCFYFDWNDCFQLTDI